MSIEDVLSIPWVAFVVFVFIAMLMIGLGEYQVGEPRPGRVASFPEYYSTEGARTSYDTQPGSGPSRYEENPWR